MNDRKNKFTELLFNTIQTCTETTIKKGSFLIQEGQIEHSLYFIVKGAVKVYYLSATEEKIIRLGYDNSFINSLSSFLSERPSQIYIEAIKETKLKTISKKEVFKLKEQTDDYNEFIETILVQQLEREVDLLIESPKERLSRVLERSPNLFQHIPLKYIASYLRMTPETLSRVRNS